VDSTDSGGSDGSDDSTAALDTSTDVSADTDAANVLAATDLAASVAQDLTRPNPLQTISSDGETASTAADPVASAVMAGSAKIDPTVDPLLAASKPSTSDVPAASRLQLLDVTLTAPNQPPAGDLLGPAAANPSLIDRVSALSLSLPDDPAGMLQRVSVSADTGVGLSFNLPQGQTVSGQIIVGVGLGNFNLDASGLPWPHSPQSLTIGDLSGTGQIDYGPTYWLQPGPSEVVGANLNIAGYGQLQIALGVSAPIETSFYPVSSFYPAPGGGWGALAAGDPNAIPSATGKFDTPAAFALGLTNGQYGQPGGGWYGGIEVAGPIEPIETAIGTAIVSAPYGEAASAVSSAIGSFVTGALESAAAPLGSAFENLVAPAPPPPPPPPFGSP